MSKHITEKIDHGDLSEKPGWVRMSLHPTMTDDEVNLIIAAVKEIAENIQSWKEDYVYDLHKNEYYHKSYSEKENIYKMFDLNGGFKSLGNNFPKD